jgi:hypothetical protein
MAKKGVKKVLFKKCTPSPVHDGFKIVRNKKGPSF